MAAAAIIAHVTDGVALARKHRLPRRIDDFILEHHGTMITRYQYNQALEAAGGDASKVDVENFRYPGPRPRSRETALLMLADGSEARARAQRPQTEEDLRKIVLSTIESAQKQGQLDHTQLTLRDLFWLTALVAMGCAWWVDRGRLAAIVEGQFETIQDLRQSAEVNGVMQFYDQYGRIIPRPMPGP